MKTIAAAALLAASTFPALAADTNKDAGVCFVYKVIAKHADADAAYRVATNKQLAKNHGMEWGRRLKEYGPDSAAGQGLLTQAVDACNRIGLRGAM